MRLLAVLDRISSRGGADIYVQDVARALAGRSGIEIHVIHGHDDGTAPDLLRMAASATRLPRLGERFATASDAEHARSLAREIARIAPDRVVAQNVMHPALLDVALAREGSVAIVQDHRAFCPGRGKVFPDESPCRESWGPVCDACFQVDGAVDAALRDRRLAIVAARGAALRSARRIVVLSRYMARELQAAGASEERLTVVAPVAPDDPHATGLPRSGHVAIVGRIAWQKGSLHALPALAAAPGVRRITYLGDGPARGELEEAATRLPPGCRVAISGWLPRADLHAELASTDVVVVPSLWAEPFGMAGLEAAALGRPVVAYAVGGIPEWLDDGQTGILVAPAAPHRLATAVASLLAHPVAAVRLAERARRHARRRFPWGRFEQRWREVVDAG